MMHYSMSLRVPMTMSDLEKCMVVYSDEGTSKGSVGVSVSV